MVEDCQRPATMPPLPARSWSPELMITIDRKPWSWSTGLR